MSNFNGDIIRDEVIKVINNLLSEEAVFDGFDKDYFEVIHNCYTEELDKYPFILQPKDINGELPLCDNELNDLCNNPNTSLFFKAIDLDTIDRLWQGQKEDQECWGLIFDLTPAFQSIIANKVYKALEDYEKDCLKTLGE